MDENQERDLVELGPNRFITLTQDRQWPKFVVTWSVRQREGDADFPIASGTVEALPSKDADEDQVWSRLRRQAEDAALAAVPDRGEPVKRQSFFARLFGRRS